mmetsp:Transcript_36965/g.77216  ORF Transcript_36965/g.77216 Transcript_36965/m.77216 type:complete len:236 (+) Transcript_36965:1030-1737(+)
MSNDSIRHTSTLPPSGRLGASSSAWVGKASIAAASSLLDDCRRFSATRPVGLLEKSTAATGARGQSGNLSLKMADSAPSMTRTTGVQRGRLASSRYLVAVSIAPLRSSLEQPEPTQTKRSFAVSSRCTSPGSSSPCDSPFEMSTGSRLSGPDLSDTRKSSVAAAAAFSAAASSPASLAPRIGPLPPSASQNSWGSSPSSTAMTLARPLRSPSRMAMERSSALLFSARFASLPFHW